MEFVLKPDAHTEIALHSQLRAGQVEIQARCRRGDFAALNAHWPELQAALAQQGVQLSPLTSPREITFADAPQPAAASSSRGEPIQAHGSVGDFASSSFAQPQGGGRAWRDPAPEMENLPLVGAMTEPPKRTTPKAARLTRRLLESWA